MIFSGDYNEEDGLRRLVGGLNNSLYQISKLFNHKGKSLLLEESGKVIPYLPIYLFSIRKV